MHARWSLRWPVLLGLVMILLIVALTVGWVLLSVFGALSERGLAPLYWTLLLAGSICLAIVLVGVITYLVLTVKAINLNRRQSNFVDSVTHELKSPIASLKLYLQTLCRRRVSLEQQQDFVRFMLADVERLDHLINHLLDAARLDRPEVERESANVDLAALLQRCVRSVSIRYQMSPDVFQLETQPCGVRGDPVELEIIFRNLIDNAVKYAGTPPRVQVSLQLRPAGQVTVRIADNGPGIPAPLRRKIFGRFVRLGSQLERDKPGTGLGLFIVRELVQRHRGRIRVRDPESGPGTVFEIQLPGAPVDAEERANRQVQEVQLG